MINSKDTLFQAACRFSLGFVFGVIVAAVLSPDAPKTVTKTTVTARVYDCDNLADAPKAESFGVQDPARYALMRLNDSCETQAAVALVEKMRQENGGFVAGDEE